MAIELFMTVDDFHKYLDEHFVYQIRLPAFGRTSSIDLIAMNEWATAHFGEGAVEYPGGFDEQHRFRYIVHPGRSWADFGSYWFFNDELELIHFKLMWGECILHG